MSGTVLLATNNAHKLVELRAMLTPLGLTVVSPAQIGLHLEIEEVGSSFSENARLKADGFRAASGMPSLADDSGLVVDALGGEPGIYSARYGGEGLDDEDRVRLVLSRTVHVPDSERSARFVAAIALALPSGDTLQFEGRVEGCVTREPRGRNGFGYDPIFFYPQYGRTFAEVTARKKAAVSHRGIAMRALLASIRDSMAGDIIS